MVALAETSHELDLIVTRQRVGKKQAQEALVASLERARDAYRAVAAAAESGGPASVAATQPQVDGAESGVNGALEAFALLGYKHA